MINRYWKFFKLYVLSEVNGAQIDDSTNIANEFNRYFVNAASDIKQAIPSNQARDELYLNDENFDISTPFESSETDENEILAIISNLNSSEAKDFYDLSNNFLRMHKKALAKPISTLINRCLKEGIFPRQLKIATVKPLFKAGDKTNVNNYRPIAILPIISKVFEYVLLNRLTDHLKNNNIINDYQFGFVAKSNTETAVLHLLSKVYSNIEGRKFSACVFLDLKKAFDCLDHKIFIEKLKKLRLSESFFNLLVSYFADRLQRVDINGVKSSFSNIQNGTFQGSVLGPMTFIFYINSIFNLNIRGSIQLYADDIVLVYGENSPSELKTAIESDLKIIRDFLSAHSLSLNPTKSQFVLFPGRQRHTIPLGSKYLEDFSVKCNNEELKRVSFIRYLGLIIDEFLEFKDHIIHISKKISSMIYAIRRIRDVINLKVLKQLYFSYVYSHLIFMNPIWSVAKQELINRLFILQKKSLRFIYHKDRLSPSIELFSEKILPLPVVNDFHLLVLAFKINHGLIKNNVALTYVNDIHNYGTRQRNNFYIYSHESRYGQADFYKRGLIKYNELDSNVKSVRSLSMFKKRLRTQLFERYLEDMRV